MFQGEREMKRLFVVPVLVALLAALSGRANADYCGAVSYQDCGGCGASACAPATHTVMKTVRRTVYEQQTVQRTRTEYQTLPKTR